MGAAESSPQIVDLPHDVSDEPGEALGSPGDAHLAAAAAAALNLNMSTEALQTDATTGKMVQGAALSDYKLESTLLGEGGFGKVRLATNTTTGHKVAVKIIKRDKLAARSEELLKREVKHHEILRHEHIVRLYTWIKTPNKYYLVMEVCSRGDLLQHLHAVGMLGEDDAREIFGQLLHGVKFCHGLGIMHRDLKLENVLLAEPPPGATSKHLVKISDFGLSDLRPPVDRLSGTYCGSPLYAAPELMDGDARAANPDGYDATRSDMWSCGIVLYALLTSQLPFDADDMTTLIHCIVRAKPRRPIPSKCGVHAADLTGRLINRDPLKRLSAAECLEHPWVTGATAPPPPKTELRSLHSMPNELPSTRTTKEKGEMAMGDLEEETVEQATDDGGDGGASPRIGKRGVSESSAFFRSLVELRRAENLAATAAKPPTTAPTVAEVAAVIDVSDTAHAATAAELSTAPKVQRQPTPPLAARAHGQHMTDEERAAIRAMKEANMAAKQQVKQA